MNFKALALIFSYTFIVQEQIIVLVKQVYLRLPQPRQSYSLCPWAKPRCMGGAA